MDMLDVVFLAVPLVFYGLLLWLIDAVEEPVAEGVERR